VTSTKIDVENKQLALISSCFSEKDIFFQFFLIEAIGNQQEFYRLLFNYYRERDLEKHVCIMQSKSLIPAS